MIDILSIDPADSAAVGSLVETLDGHFTDAERRQFLADLDAWNSAIPKKSHKAIQAYHRMQSRGAFTPPIIRRYLATVAVLATTPEWQKVTDWQQRILCLPPIPVRRAA
jgi:hypothetical protein